MIDKPSMDPNVEPPGYKPPTSAAELLERYAKGERYFVGSHATCQSGCWLRDSSLVAANLRSSVFEGVFFENLDLSGSDLSACVMKGGIENDVDGNPEWYAPHVTACCFQRALLRGASLEGVQFHRCLLDEVDLLGAQLHNVKLEDSSIPASALLRLERVGAVIDPDSYVRSAWSPDELHAFQALGGDLIGASRSVTALLLRQLRRSQVLGLSLYFNTRLSPFDRFLVDGVIFGVLARDTDCRVVQFEERGDNAIVRLVAKNPADLVAVAEALYRRVWEVREQAQERALVRLGQALHLPDMAAALTELVAKAERFELWAEDHDLPHLLASQGDAHFKARIEKETTPAGVKVAKGVLKLAGKWVLKGAEDEVVDGLKDAAEHLLPDRTSSD